MLSIRRTLPGVIKQEIRTGARQNLSPCSIGLLSNPVESGEFNEPMVLIDPQDSILVFMESAPWLTMGRTSRGTVGFFCPAGNFSAVFDVTPLIFEASRWRNPGKKRAMMH